MTYLADQELRYKGPSSLYYGDLADGEIVDRNEHRNQQSPMSRHSMANESIWAEDIKSLTNNQLSQNYRIEEAKLHKLYQEFRDTETEFKKLNGEEDEKPKKYVLPAKYEKVIRPIMDAILIRALQVIEGRERFASFDKEEEEVFHFTPAAKQ